MSLLVRGVCGTGLVEQDADRLDHLEVGHFAAAADVVGLARAALGEGEAHGGAVVPDVEPVANVLAVAVDRQRLLAPSVEDHQRDQLLGKLAGAIVVGAIGRDRRQAIGVVVGAHQMIGGGLGRGVGAVRRVRGGFGESGVAGAERAVDLVGRDVQEAEPVLFRLRERRPVGARFLEQGERAHHVGLHEISGTVDRAVHVALRGEIDDRDRLVLLQQPADQLAIADVAAHEEMARVSLQAGEVLRIAGVGQLVEIDDASRSRLASQCMDKVRTDESGAARHQDHRFAPYACVMRRLCKR